jgi:hypothetical protein
VIEALYANNTCTEETVRCALYELSESLSRNPWVDTSLTLVATLVGAVMGAFFAWLFSRNLAAQEREARQQELDVARAERELERRSEYVDRIRREWPLLIPAFREFANAERARVEAARDKTPLPGNQSLERYLSAVTTVTERLYMASSVAKGDDHALVGLLGRITSAYTPYSVHGVGVLDEAYKSLVEYVAAAPEEDAHARIRFASVLTAVLADAQEFSKQRS